MRPALLLCLALWASAAAAQPVCEVLALSGEAQRADGKPLAVGDRLEVGTQLRTGASGRVRLRFTDGSVLVLADRSQLRIEAFSAAPGQPRAAELLLEMGLVGQRVAPSANGSWKVRTPTAVTAVRGTEFSVEVADDRATAVHVKAGEVDVEPAGPQTRGLQPRQPVRLQQALNGTRCDGRQCGAAVAWSAERVQRVDQRLGSLD
jgi:hypothetical protein